MKTVIFAAIAAASALSAPAFAQDAAPFTGPRAGVTMGWDKTQGEDGFAYGVTAGYDLALTPRVTVGPEVSLGDSTIDGQGFHASREIAASLRAGYVVTPQILAFGKVGYTNARIEAGAAHTSLEGVRYGGGLEYAVTPRTYISAEYQRSEYEDNFGGRDAAIVGVGYRF
ncbi:porin family protein [Sphingobium sp. CCH11-B1]|jgi:outer membrane immunogenic protein|uniref:porin family protein n=1 Tax=Sphingobium sp. CCH11-B1 TaxID=1768781 RepID=UPI0008363860|nr:porin family protein [Sphingobium sp. CCH11-B1]MEA3390876.1 porin family protein [Pseudomonadota bacterium]